MGSADLVPGISGATIALVLNVYHPFIKSINKVLSVKTIRLLLGLRFREWAKYVNLSFILPLAAGILTCIFSFAALISYLLDHYPILFWSFFFGLIIASSLVLPNYSERFHWRKVFLFILGIIIGYIIISLQPFNTPDTPTMLFLAGMVSIGAMLLPGISGSFMLVVIGKYPTIIHAIKDIDIFILFFFSLGAITSLIVFPRLIDLIFKSGKEWFIIFISGFLIGSLKKIWPWQLTEPVTGQKIAVSPFYFQEILSQDPHILSAMTAMGLGISVIILIWYLEKRLSNPLAE